jgi:hypothetical protein
MLIDAACALYASRRFVIECHMPCQKTRISRRSANIANETLSVIAVRVGNPDRSRFQINR